MQTEENTAVTSSQEQNAIPSISKLNWLKINRKKFFLICGSSILGILLVMIGVLGFVQFHKTNSVHKVLIQTAKEAPYFTVIDTNPQDKSDGNTANPPIILTFSQPVNPANLHGYFTVNPMIPGKFTQGSNANQVIFTANFPFGEQTSVDVIINKGLKAVSGALFQNDFSFKFNTSVPKDTAAFITDGIFSVLTNTTVGRTISYSLDIGASQNADNIKIDIYKSDITTLLNALTYHNTANANSNYITQTYINNPVDTSALDQVVKETTITSDAYTFSQPSGIYLVEAVESGSVIGKTWVDVSDEGLIVRQDDQQVVIATQNIQTGSTNQDTQVTLYSLKDTPTILQQADINENGTIQLVYPQKADLIVGKTQNGYIIVPVSIPQTQADTRVVSNLSTTQSIYLYTDKPTYSPGETLRFSGIARTDNDAAYTLPPQDTQIEVWVPDQSGTHQLLSQVVTPDTHGIFNGSFTIPQSLLNNNPDPITDISTPLYAKIVSTNGIYISSPYSTSFDVIKQNPSQIISVSFDKTSYIKDEPISVHIMGKDEHGTPLASTNIKYTIYQNSFNESDEASVQNIGTDWGLATSMKDIPLTLDQDGQTSFTLNESGIESSEAITVYAYTDSSGGARTAPVYQGNLLLTFAPSKDVYQSGDTAISRIYVTDTSGNPQPNLLVKYQYYTSDYNTSTQSYVQTTFLQDSTTTDSQGMALIQNQINSTEDVTLQASVTDIHENTVNQTRSIRITDPTAYAAGQIYYHTPVLVNLDVTTDKLIYQSGDTANVTIHTPVAQNIFVTYEAGRIYHEEWISLNSGDNTYQIPITDALSPSFYVMFSYFANGVFNSEGLPITVNNPKSTVMVTTSLDKNSYMANTTATLTITTKDSQGLPIAANLTVEALDNTIFTYRTISPNKDLHWFFEQPRELLTNASASTLGVGTGMGCGGGSGWPVAGGINMNGNVTYWNTGLQTDQNGQLQLQIPLDNTTQQVIVYSSTDSEAFSEVQTAIPVNK